MSFSMNPSSIWAQLTTPYSPAGCIPYISSVDNQTPLLDPTNFYFLAGGLVYTGSQQAYQLTAAGGLRVMYADTTATPGAATINKPAGRVKIAAGASSVVITNSYCFTSSIVIAQLETNDATLTRIIVTPAAGSFTITGNAAATAAVTVSFQILNVF